MPTHPNKTKTHTTSNEDVKPLNDSNLHHQIETRAFETWLSSGRSQGNDVAHWLQSRKRERFEKRCESGVKVPQFRRKSRWSSE
jgi:hypothetical protein